jgi:hypothetical protein
MRYAILMNADGVLTDLWDHEWKYWGKSLFRYALNSQNVSILCFQRMVLLSKRFLVLKCRQTLSRVHQVWTLLPNVWQVRCLSTARILLCRPHLFLSLVLCICISIHNLLLSYRPSSQHYRDTLHSQGIRWLEYWLSETSWASPNLYRKARCPPRSHESIWEVCLSPKSSLSGIGKGSVVFSTIS